jgi:hypothetical protein
MRKLISYNSTALCGLCAGEEKCFMHTALSEAAVKVIQDRCSIREYMAEPVSDHDLNIERGKGAPFLQGDGPQSLSKNGEENNG